MTNTSTNTTPSGTTQQHPAEHATGEEIKKYIGTGLRYVVPIGISVGLIIWLFKKVNFNDVMTTIHEGVDFFWIAVMMLITMVSHMIRGVRWGLQLRAAGVRRMPVVCEWVTIWGAYALNLVFPQLGEAWRCVFVSRREKAKLSTVIGTDVGDRGSDLVVVIILLVVALIVAHPEIEAFITKYSFGRDVDEAVRSAWLWICLGVGIGGLWFVCHYLKEYKWVRALDQNLQNMWSGFKVIFTMKKWWLYLILTAAIWTCYFFETYVCFQAFPFTRRLIEDPGMALGFRPGLVVFVFGSCSMAIPSNGGLGPWNLAVMFALTLFGCTNTEGTAYSLVVWSFQSMMLIALGLFSAGYISVTGRKHPVPSGSSITTD
jgi:hypothetical protein